MTDTVHMVPVYEKDLKAVWRLLVERNPETGNAAQEVTTTAAKLHTEDGWTDQRLDDYYGKCKPVQRAILVRVAETGEKGTPCHFDELFAAAKAAYDGDGQFTRKTLNGNFAWLTKYSEDGKWPLKNFTEGDVWYFQMDPATAKTILRLRDKYAALGVT